MYKSIQVVHMYYYSTVTFRRQTLCTWFVYLEYIHGSHVFTITINELIRVDSLRKLYLYVHTIHYYNKN